MSPAHGHCPLSLASLALPNRRDLKQTHTNIWQRSSPLIQSTAARESLTPGAHVISRQRPQPLFGAWAPRKRALRGLMDASPPEGHPLLLKAPYPQLQCQAVQS